MYYGDQDDQEGPMGSTVWFLKIKNKKNKKKKEKIKKRNFFFFNEFRVVHRVSVLFYNGREENFLQGFVMCKSVILTLL